ncbi:uncharacterized protein ASPGLDRAFT_40137 [Aspergillus glaucus CBS 516.65]|uniref:Uncharacterized protein n=1 Tax=Aspergillus glaucus CBS 516.65 TaxID=1160497 RepID=A0A1L9V5D1_ASPGL|nr:hypothetical protein ASPGLDRAFT_40137 [Aspergillus glaucus CBS 516.65]OJJ79133.1 hypothetical protein ASPGLDRAFT_40137 [Aspergillus glaucus CBS 516.65]
MPERLLPTIIAAIPISLGLASTELGLEGGSTVTVPAHFGTPKTAAAFDFD